MARPSALSRAVAGIRIADIPHGNLHVRKGANKRHQIGRRFKPNNVRGHRGLTTLREMLSISFPKLHHSCSRYRATVLYDVPNSLTTSCSYCVSVGRRRRCWHTPTRRHFHWHLSASWMNLASPLARPLPRAIGHKGACHWSGNSTVATRSRSSLHTEAPIEPLRERPDQSEARQVMCWGPPNRSRTPGLAHRARIVPGAGSSRL